MIEPTGVVKAPSRPGAYPDHPSEGSVERTHTSWLFPAKGFVYKVRKPVNFSFLDFTSLETRRRFCEAGTRLNRRPEPDVYLGGRATTAAGGEILLGGRRNVSDDALQVRRLPAGRMPPALLAAGGATSDTVCRPVALLAAFHAKAIRRPWLLLCCGLMGSGKSVLAGALAERAGLHVLSTDVIRKASAGLQPTTPIHMTYGEGLYTVERIDTTYRQMFQKAESLLAEGHSVVLDASFIHRRHRLQAVQLAARVGAGFCIVECWCPEEELRRRLEARAARGGSVSDGRWELLEQQRRAFEPLSEVPPAHHLRVNTTQATELVVEAVLSHLAERSESPSASG
jgi:predicted kinase